MAEDYGIPKSDVQFARECLVHREYALCLDTIAAQLYEHNIKIDKKFTSAYYKICHDFGITSNDYQYLLELEIKVEK